MEKEKCTESGVYIHRSAACGVYRHRSGVWEAGENSQLHFEIWELKKKTKVSI